MRGQFDNEDSLLAAVFVLASSNSIGLVEGPSLLGYDLGMTLVAVSGITLTLAFVVSVAVLGVVILTNDVDLRTLDTEYQVAAVGLPVLMVMLVISPPLHEFVRSHAIVGFVVLGVESAGYTAISYLA